MELKDKIVLITGGSSGIGKAIVNDFINKGSQVIFTYFTNERGAKESSDKTMAIKTDVTDAKDVKQLFSTIKERYDHLDILINNAGRHIFSDDQLDIDYWQKNFEVYLFSAVRCTQQALKLMPKGSKIINIASIYGEEKMGETGLIPYSAAKAALINLTRTLAKKLAPGITVNAIAPGYVDTPGWGKLTNERKTNLGHNQLIDRFIKPEEIAHMVITIAQNDALTGEVIVVDGGLSLKTL